MTYDQNQNHPGKSEIQDTQEDRSKETPKSICFSFPKVQLYAKSSRIPSFILKSQSKIFIR
ncbi:MAG: hypothetical protein A3A96_01690 [Candidatus Zambryskibacteria bacterium RIFCSPLOWO2_01_FULL_39_39]|uniref:Uncharacterized protein n=1 Tax=Candidatus Zambryskibacteria bacterium RIFCSPLOWO2_01_FULL_39_39 TaxID=1802758 RepID=A0A1G2TVR8_9BACT|nr:MAG: hypothetical protein A3A96_01690 [Candidatus Zambryskibacteria bacterium RIFCSPLOWO2_01_FULL_39_39]